MQQFDMVNDFTNHKVSIKASMKFTM